LALATDSAALQALIELPAIFVCVSWLVGNRGRGQDGHIAYNQTRRHPYSRISIEELRNSTVRVQENNLDTVGCGPRRRRRWLVSWSSIRQNVAMMNVVISILEISV
jgi:hypothetical protein